MGVGGVMPGGCPADVDAAGDEFLEEGSGGEVEMAGDGEAGCGLGGWWVDGRGVGVTVAGMPFPGVLLFAVVVGVVVYWRSRPAGVWVNGPATVAVGVLSGVSIWAGLMVAVAVAGVPLPLVWVLALFECLIVQVVSARIVWRLLDFSRPVASGR